MRRLNIESRAAKIGAIAASLVHLQRPTLSPGFTEPSVPPRLLLGGCKFDSRPWPF
jgi:hypothetical protein